MVSINTAYNTSYASLAAGRTAISSQPAIPSSTTNEPGATSITLSPAALAALQTRDFATVTAEARDKLTALLKTADRASPLLDGKLAVDLSSLDLRELFAIASNGAERFTGDEQDAAGLEMQRRFDAALAGPAAIADVTGNYTGLYKAAADYLDSLGPEEKADPEWIAARAALTEGLKQLQADPKTLPEAGDSDPVALYLALKDTQTTGPRPIADVAADTRKTLDKLYADAIASGKVPSFNKSTTIGTFIDLSKFDSGSLSAMVLDTTQKFTPEEVRVAEGALRTKSGAALLAGFQSAAKSSDPTAFSQNIIGIYASMSTEERQAAGWTDSFYTAAVASYESTTKLMSMFADAGADTSFASWMGK